MVDSRRVVDLVQEDLVQEVLVQEEFLLVVDFHQEVLDSDQVDSHEGHLEEVSHPVEVCHPVDLVALVDFLQEVLQVNHSVESVVVVVVEITAPIKLSLVFKPRSKLK